MTRPAEFCIMSWQALGHREGAKPRYDQMRRAEPHGPAPALLRTRSVDYWTVIVPFIPIARCGVQWKG
jgi:hypothetical protein